MLILNIYIIFNNQIIFMIIQQFKFRKSVFPWIILNIKSV